MAGKGSYLEQLTAGVTMQSAPVGRELEGSSPPSVFIGRWNYPKVLAGPMVAPVKGDTRVMDTPEAWIPARTTQEEIIGYRLQLVRGTRAVGVRDVEDRFVAQLQEIALSSSSRDAEASFARTPQGMVFSEDSVPHGPSAAIERFDVAGGAWDRRLERVFHDTDLSASEAVTALHRAGLPFSQIQKALSVGAMGTGRARRLVPTRWSITACDTTIGDRLQAEVRHNPVIDCIRVHEFDSLHNHYAVLLLPTGWQYEWLEAFLHILGREELVFADHEGFRGKKEYSQVGGCFYSCRMAVLEALAREGVQAGAIVLREASRGYVPLGVFNVRENVRSAMCQPAAEFEDVPSALASVAERLQLPLCRFEGESALLRDIARGRGQTTLGAFCR
ncbi:MAG TPA: hypothetical protein ENN85_00630 [Methanoculleus sp.]|nr:hypothetical protein [Methanoculleus sp.]